MELVDLAKLRVVGTRLLLPSHLLSLSLSLLLHHPHPPSLLFSSPSLSALEANALAGLQASGCQIGGPYSRLAKAQAMVGEKNAERTRDGERETEREGERELERKGEKKEAALGSASGRMRSSNIDSALYFFWFFFTFSASLFCALF